MGFLLRDKSALLGLGNDGGLAGSDGRSTADQAEQFEGGIIIEGTHKLSRFGN